MKDNGMFRRKKGFTIAGNTLTRDKGLSLKAKGLYLLIMSYITYEDLTLTKSFLLSMCAEKGKAFESAWNELKDKGYLKVYLQPAAKGWRAEYELLDEPRAGAHTYYLTASGEVSCTNLDREKKRKIKEEHIIQKGSNAENCNGEGSNVEGEYNIKQGNKTFSKTNDNILSFIQEDGMDEEELMEVVKEEIEQCGGIPYEYSEDIRKMTCAIHYITDWNTFYPNGYQDSFYQNTFNLAVTALIEMACEKEVRVYNKRQVTCTNIIDKINQSMKGEPCKSIHCFLTSAIDDYIKAASKEEIKYPRNYIKSCILESFDTYYVKFGSLFNRTFQNATYLKLQQEN